MKRHIVYGTSAIITAMVGQPAIAQAANAVTAAQDVSVEELEGVKGRLGDETDLTEAASIIVTGTRLSSGFQTPTPVTVVTAEELQLASPGNLADATQRLPAFRGSVNTTRRQGGSPNSSNGQNLLDLRGLGAQRNLVLLNGQRIVASNASGSVDINLIPQDMVKTLEVVTGGASAAYGSDAVSGVVNFILDTRFQGFKGSLQSGISTYGDAGSTKGGLSWGGSFAGDRLRVIASAEAMYGSQIDLFAAQNRDWYGAGWGIVSNPVAGAFPKQIITTNIQSASMTYGGLVPSGPLKGVAFGLGGVPYTHDFGVQSGIWQVGGNGIRAIVGMTPKQQRYTGYLRTELDVTDNLLVAADLNWGYTNNINYSYPQYQNGQFGFTIYNDNAFLSPEVKARMAQAKVTSIPVGRHSIDVPMQMTDAVQETKRGAISFVQKFGATWRADGYFSHGESRQDTYALNMPISRNLYAAVDAVINPATGQIVCRSTLQGLDPDCAPMNIFGNGSISAASIAYVYGSSNRFLDLVQDVGQVNISGDLPESFSLGAGPISLAVGGEYRRESSSQDADLISQQVTNFTGIRGGPASLNNRPGAFQTFNPLPFGGNYNVKEVYAEVGVPILRDAPIAKSLVVNGAGRAAWYSNTGLAKSWKLGVIYEPSSDIRIRATRSHDIRGPNILELFNPRSTNASNILYKGVVTGYTGFSTGNVNLRPEESDTFTAGMVLQPSFIPGLSLSADVYSIKIKDAITQIGAQGIADQCALGSIENCALIQVASGGSLIITNPFQNLALLNVEGLDLEVLFKAPFLNGDLTLRALANYTAKFQSQTPGAVPIDSAGDIRESQPKWQGNFQVTWSKGPFSIFVMERYVGSGKYNTRWVEGIDVNDNYVGNEFYTDVTMRYVFPAYGGNITSFLTVNNLFDKDPPIVPQPSTFQQQTNATLYDTIGRYITLGFRFNF